MLNFQYPIVLAGLALVAISVIFYLLNAAKKRKAFKKLGDPALVAELTKQNKPGIQWKKFALLASALGLLIVSLANLRMPAGAQQLNRNGIDVMVALDVSKSMLAQDVQPSRLERAKQVLSKLIDKLQNDRVGIVIFAGKAYIQMPLSADHGSAKMFLNAAGAESVPTQGTVIAEALKMCNASFNTQEKKYKNIVLVTDGEDHDPEAVGVAEALAKEGVVINTIGVGSAEGSVIIDPATGTFKTDEQGSQVISKLNQELLASISKPANGIYQNLSNSDQVIDNILRQISTMDQRALRDDTLMNYDTLFPYFAGLALLLLLVEMLLSEVKKMRAEKSSKTKKMKPVAAATLLLISMHSFAQGDKKSISEGNTAYKQKNYPAAANAYLQALKENPYSVTAAFNLGNAYYKGGKKDEALNAYLKSAKAYDKPADKSNAFYNAGVAYQNDKKLEECIAVYKDALRQNPGNADARHNLQIALRQKQKQDQQQNQDQKNQDNKDKQNPQQKNAKMDEQEAENKLKALAQEERKLQDKMHRQNVQSPDQPAKDW